ncbi:MULTISPECIES: AAA family ATPase [Cyanophyceae]|uniref:ATP-binding protein n=1 Tax=Leptolyngbya subtilissima DQ-A4 TaxID=2933933 RepID=A0ABV0JY94_9CYAN|nr:ATP-binding protein [Nodosilinea sp. FACHB-141]MBD2112078.1 ATP-binding protein [Nodosilinea sp. FACHB-141]
MADVTLHLICGKIAAGKSTKARELASQPRTVLINQDEWLSTLYPDELNTLADYVRYSTRLNTVMGIHVEALLRAGLSVVLDFPANTVKSRQWMKAIVERAEAAHVLYYLDVPDAECKRRLRLRNESGTHEFAPTEADFDQFTSYFVPPAPEEGFNVITIHG